MVITMPVYTVFFFVFTLANIATPLSANFVGEFMTFTGGFQQNPVLTILGALSIVLSAAYSIWLFNRVSFGASSVYLTPVGDINRREFMLLLPLLFLTLLIGIFPNFLLEPLHLSVSNLLMHNPPTLQKREEKFDFVNLVFSDFLVVASR